MAIQRPLVVAPGSGSSRPSLPLTIGRVASRRPGDVAHSDHGNATATAAPGSGIHSPARCAVDAASSSSRISTPPPPPGAVATAPGYPPYGYAAPPVGGERAGFGIRLGGYLLDGLLYGLLMAAFVIPGGVFIGASFSDCYTIEGSDGTTRIECPAGSPDGAMIAGGIALIVVGVLLVAYIYLRALGRTGQPGGPGSSASRSSASTPASRSASAGRSGASCSPG